MSDFLTPVYTKTLPKRPANAKSFPNTPGEISAQDSKGVEYADLNQELRGRPDEARLKVLLRTILTDDNGTNSILLPSSHTTSLIKTLITVTIPDFWASSTEVNDLIIKCMTSLPGIAGLLAELKDLLIETRSSSNGNGQKQNYIAILETILDRKEVLIDLWKNLKSCMNDIQRRLIWKEVVSLLISGRIVACVAQVSETLQNEADGVTASWLTSGVKYNEKLAIWFIEYVKSVNLEINSSGLKLVAVEASNILTKSLGFGYAQEYVQAIIEGLVLSNPTKIKSFSHVLSKLRPSDIQKVFRLSLLALQKSPSPDGQACLMRTSAFISTLLEAEAIHDEQVLDLLSDSKNLTFASQYTLRAIITSIGESAKALERLVEVNLDIFADVLFIRHAPILQQEMCAQVILIAISHLHKIAPESVLIIARSASHNKAVSSRLGSSSEKVKALGMCVAMALSRLVDQPGEGINFDVQDVKTAWAEDLMALLYLNDKAGDASNLRTYNTQNNNKLIDTSTSILDSRRSAPAIRSHIDKHSNKVLQQGSKIIDIVDEDEMDDDDIKTYPKPDSDPEDEDDDPTLVKREKTKVPVYIRDLISGLKDGENYDQHKLCLEQAASLIRRKTGFGKEVSDHAMQLANILAGLQDHLELDEFLDLRLQALIALLISDIENMGPWFSRQIFEGDYSLTQRSTLLSAIGLGSRELAGYFDNNTVGSQLNDQSFPSKRLPDKYHRLYSASPNKDQLNSPIDSVSTSLTSSILKPILAKAVDLQSGPDILKLSTISSKLTTSSSVSNIKPKKRIISNTLAKSLSSKIFTPLIGHFLTYTRSTSPSSQFLSPSFLETFLKTLAITLHSSGQGTTSLPELTSDFWSLLLSPTIRKISLRERNVCEAVLFGFVTILETNGVRNENDSLGDGTRRLAEENSREVVESREYASLVLDNTGSSRMVISKTTDRGREGKGSGDEETRLRGLAAGVVVKCSQVVEKWQRIMVGDMLDEY